jgi:hypothetical protein
MQLTSNVKRSRLAVRGLRYDEEQSIGLIVMFFFK